MSARNIASEEFSRLIAGEKPVLVDFWAPWCTYCRRIGPAYDKIAQQYDGQVEVVKVNIDDEAALSDKEGIDVIPTLVMYRGGANLGHVVAPDSKAAIEEFINGVLGA